MAIKVLFQGDTITDVGRSREYDRLSGSGYATLVAARLGFETPGEYECVNRGVGGSCQNRRSLGICAGWACVFRNGGLCDTYAAFGLSAQICTGAACDLSARWSYIPFCRRQGA